MTTSEKSGPATCAVGGHSITLLVITTIHACEAPHRGPSVTPHYPRHIRPTVTTERTEGSVLAAIKFAALRGLSSPPVVEVVDRRTLQVDREPETVGYSQGYSQIARIECR